MLTLCVGVTYRYYGRPTASKKDKERSFLLINI